MILPNGVARLARAVEPLLSKRRRRGPRLLLALVLLTSGCTSTIYEETPDAVKVRFGMGGFVQPVMARYRSWSEAGKRIIIDGQVISADAFGAFSAPNACYTENVIFSPHALSHYGVVPARQATHEIASMLPSELEVWFRNNIVFYDFIGFAALDFAKVHELWPEGACEGAAERWARKVARRRTFERLHTNPNRL